jgi:hypothetical protein
MRGRGNSALPPRGSGVVLDVSKVTTGGRVMEASHRLNKLRRGSRRHMNPAHKGRIVEALFRADPGRGRFRVYRRVPCARLSRRSGRRKEGCRVNHDPAARAIRWRRRPNRRSALTRLGYTTGRACRRALDLPWIRRDGRRPHGAWTVRSRRSCSSCSRSS